MSVVTRRKRARFLGGAWLSYAKKGGGPAPREYGWRRALNINGFGFNRGDNSYWIEFRRFSRW